MKKAVGIHVFAGGFTVGVQKVFDVAHQLEVHGFGLETAEHMCKLEAINCPADQWPHIDAEFAFGNPRCTGFSTITSGYGENTHGPWAKQTCDIHEFCQYAAGRYDIAIWESVQQAFSVGRPLLDYLRDEVFAPKHYRIAHVFVNAATFGNPQMRKRYFFVAYRDDRPFNITPPPMSGYYCTPYHAMYDIKDRPVKEFNWCDEDYSEDSYVKLTDDEKATLPYLPNGWCMNTLARWFNQAMPPKFQETWQLRNSDIPFSLHCPTRLNWLARCPTLHGSCGRFIHPEHDRACTVMELARLMGWPEAPRGKLPFAQIAKGIVPAVGEWLAQQAESYLDNAWGSEDWESSYDARTGEWVGGDTTGQLEKTFDLTSYVGRTLQEHTLEQVQQHQLDDVKRRWELDSRRPLPEPRWWDPRGTWLRRVLAEPA
jgi:site-specific DNA-cytosine methylase